MIILFGIILALLHSIKATSVDWTYYYESGSIEEEITYVNDTPHGPFKRYYESGFLEQEGQFIAGLEDGIWKIYYESGQLYIEGSFTNGHRTGRWSIFYEDRSCKQDRSKSGQCQDEDGKLMAEGLFEQYVIPFKEYYESGSIQVEGLFYNSQEQIGYCKYYYESGILEKEGEFINGLEHGHWKMYYPSGYLASENMWDQGFIIASRNYSDYTLLHDICTDPLIIEYL